MRVRWWIPLVALGAAVGWPRAEAAPRQWRQVHPTWRRAYVCSFRSPDLLTNEADEQWGGTDGRLIAGMIRTDFPEWLRSLQPDFQRARDDERPILISIATHSGYGTGLVTYSPDVTKAEVVDYPWLVRTLTAAGLGTPDVTIAIDTCNAQATAYHQLRPDLAPGGVAEWSVFRRWRSAHAARQKLSIGESYRLFEADNVLKHMARSARGNRENVKGVEYQPLTSVQRSRFDAELYGPKGVIYGTPALFNLLRLGKDTTGTLTANLLSGRLSGQVMDTYLSRNKGEFRRFTEFGFLAAAGTGSSGADPDTDPEPPRRAPKRKTVANPS
jgi:hypothetical protein